MFNILVAEDDSGTRRLMRAILEGGGYRVLTAEYGEVALEMLAHEHVDLIVLDVMMPQMTGLEATIKCRQDDQLKNTPVILLTANAGEKDYKLGQEAGANKYITKPFSPKELMEAISETVKQ